MYHDWMLACGWYNLAFAVFHAGFWRLFAWKTALRPLHFANRAIVQMLNVQLIVFFLLMAYVCWMFPDALLHTPLGNAILLGNAFFWLIRTVQQAIFLRKNHWAIHALTAAFVLGVALFSIPVLAGR